MQITIDQLKDALRKHPCPQCDSDMKLTRIAFDNEGKIPMSAVLEIGGLPLALLALDESDPKVIEFRTQCFRGVSGASTFAIASEVCESLTLSVEQRHGPLRAFKARNREIERQIRIFRRVLCATSPSNSHRL